jgi:hypothetical protein
MPDGVWAAFDATGRQLGRTIHFSYWPTRLWESRIWFDGWDGRGGYQRRFQLDALHVPVVALLS